MDDDDQDADGELCEVCEKLTPIVGRRCHRCRRRKRAGTPCRMEGCKVQHTVVGVCGYHLAERKAEQARRAVRYRGPEPHSTLTLEQREKLVAEQAQRVARELAELAARREAS